MLDAFQTLNRVFKEKNEKGCVSINRCLISVLNKHILKTQAYYFVEYLDNKAKDLSTILPSVRGRHDHVGKDKTLKRREMESHSL